MLLLDDDYRDDGDVVGDFYSTPSTEGVDRKFCLSVDLSVITASFSEY